MSPALDKSQYSKSLQPCLLAGRDTDSSAKIRCKITLKTDSWNTNTEGPKNSYSPGVNWFQRHQKKIFKHKQYCDKQQCEMNLLSSDTANQPHAFEKMQYSHSHKLHGAAEVQHPKVPLNNEGRMHGKNKHSQFIWSWRLHSI